MSFIRKITDSGIRDIDGPQKKRSIILSNYLELILMLASLFLFVVIDGNHNFSAFVEMVIEVIVFGIPVLFNRLRWTNFSRLYLCWVPPTLVIWFMGKFMQDVSAVPVSSYDGLRFYLLAFSCIPYLLFEKSNLPMLIICIVPGFACIIFCDIILDWMGVGYAEHGTPDAGYAFTSVRVLIAYLIIGGISGALNYIIAKSDEINLKLLNELTKKNKLIQSQSEDEVRQLNQQLITNLDQLSEREFILNQSQRIAKVGSWEFRKDDNTTFWSEEMYNIFGLDRSAEISLLSFTDFMVENQSQVIRYAMDELLRRGKSYDLTLQIRIPLGHHKWVRIYAYAVYKDDNVSRVGGICHDVTFYKNSEEMIRLSETKYRSLFEQASDPIMITDTRGKFLDVNAALCNLFGYSKAELLQFDLYKLLAPGQLQEKPIQFDVLARGEQIFNERQMVHKDGTFIEVEANVKMFSEGQVMAIVRDITQRKKTEQEKERAHYLLNERVKELTTLYRLGRILNNEQNSVDEAFSQAVSILPWGWQYSRIAAARIRVNESVYSTSNFAEGPHSQIASFGTSGNLRGSVEVVYLEKVPQEFEDAFFIEERALINMVAEMLSTYLERRLESERLSKAQANLTATINNTAIFIWSVDLNFNLITFNRPFYNYSKETYGIELQLGDKVFRGDHAKKYKDIRERWRTFYLRALSGEIVSVEEQSDGQYFRYSLSPIIENALVIGVSVFAENITEQKIQDRMLAEASQQLNEMKLMALRSVMSPHFIFNVLNSIQFYIAKNDRLNAINYLSMFSKLIRSVLNHSVDNKIKLPEEIDLLKNYIHLEMTRFENKFQFHLNISPDVDIDSIMIPSLLIQPYVENAILHGLYTKPDTGTLTISIHEDENALVFQIEDDGIGRDEARKLRQQNFPTHKSMGIKLTEERLRLINEYHKTTFQVEDLKDGDKALGTRVTIRILLSS